MRQVAFEDMTDGELEYVYSREVAFMNTPSGVPMSGFIYSNLENARKEIARRSTTEKKPK